MDIEIIGLGSILVSVMLFLHRELTDRINNIEGVIYYYIILDENPPKRRKK